MNTETQPQPTPEQLNADEAQHQQRPHDGGGDAPDCLHCALEAAYLAWVDRQVAAQNLIVPAHVGTCVGAFIGGVTMDCANFGPEALAQFSQMFTHGQNAKIEQRLAQQEAAGTKH